VTAAGARAALALSLSCVVADCGSAPELRLPGEPVIAGETLDVTFDEPLATLGLELDVELRDEAGQGSTFAHRLRPGTLRCGFRTERSGAYEVRVVGAKGTLARATAAVLPLPPSR